MGSKKAKIDYGAMQNAQPKQWKETPPGPEQRELERLFKSKLINPEDTALNVRSAYPLFSTFSPTVFAAHFRKTRAKMGMFTMLGESNDENTNNSTNNSTNIVELGASSNSKLPEPCVQNFCDEASKISFITPPYVAWTFTNHEKQCDFVCIALPILSGSQNLSFSISEDGLQLTINYAWLSAIYNPNELFADELKANKKVDDPKIHALRSHLLECGLTPKSNPQGKIVISLPQRVRREQGTFQKKAVELEDANMILLEFMAYQQNRIIEEIDTTITFNRNRL